MKGTRKSKTRSNLGNNRFNNFRLAANRMTKRFLGSCLKNTIRSVINAVCLLLINPLGWLILALVLGMIYIPTPVINAEEYVSANPAEYRALNKAMDKESDRFFNDYHAAVSSSMLSPILYTFWGREAFEEEIVRARGKGRYPICIRESEDVSKFQFAEMLLT